MAKRQEYFNPLMSPPDLDLAEKHSAANKVATIVAGTEKDVCICCGLAHQKKELPLWCSTRDFEFIGSGYVLWFSSTAYVSMMFFLCFWMSYHKILINYATDACDHTYETLHPCEDDWIHKYSIANYGREFDSTYVWTHVVYIIFLYISAAIFKNKLHNEHKIIDIETDTAADYTIMVTNLPNYATKDDVKLFFNQTLPGVEVHRVSMAYNIERLAKLKKEKHHIVEELFKAHAEHFKNATMENNQQEVELMVTQANNAAKNHQYLERNATMEEIDDPRYNEINAKHAKIKEEISAEQEKILGNHAEYFTGIAYVSFNKMKHADLYTSRYTISGVGWFFRGCKYKLRYPTGNGSNVRLRIDPAPEADEVLWENLRFKYKVQNKWKAVTAFVVTVVLLITFGIIFAIKYGKYVIKKKYYGHVITETNEKGEHIERYEHLLSDEEHSILQLIAIAIFVVCKITNKIFDHIVTDLTVLEKHYSVAKFCVSAVAKTVVSQFVNTSCLVMIVHWAMKSNEEVYIIWGFGSLLVDIWYLLIFNAAFVPILHLINFTWIGKLFKRCKLRRNRDSKTFIQKQAHIIMEGPRMDAIKCYTNIYQLFLTGLAFQPVFPMSTGILFISLILVYWIEKFYLLRVYSLPKLLQSEVAMESLVFFKVGAFVLSLSHWYFSLIMSENGDDPNPLTIVMIVVTFALIFVPIEDSFIHFYSYTGEEADIKEFLDYSTAAAHFTTDYDRANPISRKKDIVEYLKNISEKQKEDFFHGNTPKSARQPLLAPHKKSADGDSPFNHKEVENGGHVMGSPYSIHNEKEDKEQSINHRLKNHVNVSQKRLLISDHQNLQSSQLHNSQHQELP